MHEVKPFILGIEGLALSDREREIFRDAPPFGVIVFLRNVDNPDQIHKLVDDIKSATDEQTLMFVDQEGGRVQRFVPPYWTQFPIARDFDDLEGQEFEDAVYALYALISDELILAGMDVNCAPCLDLRNNLTASFLQDRTFGSDPKRVIAAGKASIRAMKERGIAPVIKHLPGHGQAMVDSHIELPQVEFADDPYEKLPEDANIFRIDYGVDMAMNAHILYSQIDPNYPLTLSSKGIDFIKNNLGFKGLIMSDDLAMKALNGTQSALAKRAFDAGLDVALACSGKIEDIEEIYALDIVANEQVLKTHGKLLEDRSKRPAPLSKSEKNDLNSMIKLS